MENPLELELVYIKEESRFQVWIQGYCLGACIGSGSSETEAMQSAATNLEATLKLIQENSPAIKRTADE